MLCNECGSNTPAGMLMTMPCVLLGEGAGLRGTPVGTDYGPTSMPHNLSSMIGIL